MTKTIIITAGGKGLRMGGELPKQFLPIQGKPILLHTIEQFYRYDSSIQIVLVLPTSHISHWKMLISEQPVNVMLKVVVGGDSRYHSIKNGLAKATGDLIGVHDGVRPFVSLQVISNVFEAAQKHGAAIPVMPIKESVRQIIQTKSIAVNRDDFRIVQTPQCFRSDILQEAYAKGYQPNFTDDASVVEAAGYDISIVDGNEENIKITTPIDLKFAKLLLDY